MRKIKLLIIEGMLVLGLLLTGCDKDAKEPSKTTEVTTEITTTEEVTPTEEVTTTEEVITTEEATTTTTEEITTEEPTTEADSAEKPSDTANSAEPTTEANSTTAGLSSVYADLDNRSFAYNGVVYTLGVSTLQDMIDDGVPFDEEDIANAGNNLSPNKQSQGFKIILGDYYSAQVYMGNWTDDGKPIAECPITQIYLPVKQDMDNSMLTFAFPLDITEEELVANSGEPTELREFVPEGESYSNNTYNYKRDGERYAGTSGYSFQFMKGVLKYLYIDIN